MLARGRLRTLRRAVDVFGLHLAGIDLRQNSDVHERTVNELLETTCPGAGYTGLSEHRRVALLMRADNASAPHVAVPVYSAETGMELSILRTAADAHRHYGKRPCLIM